MSDQNFINSHKPPTTNYTNSMIQLAQCFEKYPNNTSQQSICINENNARLASLQIDPSTLSAFQQYFQTTYYTPPTLAPTISAPTMTPNITPMSTSAPASLSTAAIVVMWILGSFIVIVLLIVFVYRGTEYLGERKTINNKKDDKAHTTHTHTNTNTNHQIHNVKYTNV